MAKVNYNFQKVFIYSQFINCHVSDDDRWTGIRFMDNHKDCSFIFNIVYANRQLGFSYIQYETTDRTIDYKTILKDITDCATVLKV